MKFDYISLISAAIVVIGMVCVWLLIELKMIKLNANRNREENYSGEWSHIDFSNVDPNTGGISMNRPFIELFPEIVLALDIDTTRFMEFVYAFRAKFGLDTGFYVANIPGSEHTKITWFEELFKELGMVCQCKSSIVYRGFVMDETNSDIPKLVVSVTRYNPSEPYSIVLVGDDDLRMKYEQYFIDTFSPPDIKQVRMITGVTKEGTFRESQKTIQQETSDVGYDEFYPFIEGGLTKLLEEYETAKESVLLLIGTWGTGKSTLIRTLMLMSKVKNFGICNSGEALKHPEIVAWISEFRDGSMVSLEDADRFIMSRENGNEQMSALLNAADGVMQNDSKIIISTNLPSINSVDQALIRPGRTFKTIVFRKLTIEEANKARARINLPELPEDINVQELTLSEALNFERQNNIIVAPKRVVGFG